MDAQQNVLSITGIPSQMDENEVVLSAELPQSTGPSFQQLNEYCLLEIFSWLGPRDLCSLADTCSLFKRIAQRAFPTGFEISIGYYGRRHNFSSQKYWEHHLTTEDVAGILRRFGSNLSTLSIHEHNTVVMNAVAKYCSADDSKLKRMHIHTVYDTEDLRVKFKSIFQRLLALEFNGEYVKSIQDVQSLDLSFDSLVKLEMIDVKNIDPILMSTFPKLEIFIFRDYYCEESDALLIFLGRHNKIRILDLGIAVEFSDDVAESIGNSCTELEKLLLRGFLPSVSFDFHKLQDLSKLKMLEIDTGMCRLIRCMRPIQLAGLLQTFAKSLEIVKTFLVNDDPTEVVDALSQLQNMRKLRLRDYSPVPIQWEKLTQLTNLRLHFSKYKPCTAEGVLNIISQLVNLEILKIRKFVLTDDVYMEIVKIVELRPHVLRFKCGYSLSWHFVENLNCGEHQKFELWRKPEIFD